MKIFAVYTKVELTKKPDWLNGFRSRFDEPYEYHVTLKLPCVIEDAKVPEIKAKLADFFSNLKIPNHKLTLTFNSLKVHRESPEDICIMINAERNEEIFNLQKNIFSILSDYKQYLKIKYKIYEENFSPHITIGRNLDEQAYEKASLELKQDYTCEGVITKVVLGVVNNNNVTEANDPNNQTVYNL